MNILSEARTHLVTSLLLEKALVVCQLGYYGFSWTYKILCYTSLHLFICLFHLSLSYYSMYLQVTEGAVLELMEQDSKDSAQSSSTSTYTTDTASQPEYKVQHHSTRSISAYPSTYLPSLRPCTNNPRLPVFVHLPLTCNSSLAERLCLNANITAFVIVAYPLACESQSWAPGSFVSTDDQDKEVEWDFCGLGRLAKSLLTTET